MGSRVRKLIGIGLILVSVLVTGLPIGATYASNAKEDFLRDNDTLSEYTGTATTVSVPDDIKVIGEKAFEGNQYIEQVKLGNNVKSIMHGAFANCTSIMSIKLPDSLEYIDSAAFSGCTNLTAITLGKKTADIGPAAFAGCKQLVSVSIPKQNPNFRYESGALYDNRTEHLYAYLNGNSYDTYYMPNTVKNISQYSFWGNEDLLDVYLSSALEKIPGNAFANCKNMQYIQIPYSVNSIDAKAFANCISLKDVVIPASVKYIDPTAFDGCINLNIIADEGTAAYDFFKNFDRSDVAVSELGDSIIPVPANKTNTSDYISNVNLYGDGGKSVNSNGLIDASTDPSNVEWMPSVNALNIQDDSSVLGKTIVVGGKAVFFINRDMAVKSISNNPDNAGDVILPESDSTGTDEDLDSVSFETPNSETEGDSSVIYDSSKGGYLPKYTVVDNRIAAQAYYAQKLDTDYSIPAGTEQIGRFSYARTNIETLHIPQGVKSIGYGAFYHCDNLKEVEIPSSVERIDGYAFDNTLFLNNFKNGNNSEEFLIVGDGILLAYGGNSAIVGIPEGVKTIGAACFKDNRIITAVNLPNSLTCIDSDAFRNCQGLKVVTGGDNVEHIGDRAFMGCPIDNCTIGSSVSEIGLGAYDFSSTDKSDESKVIRFMGKDLPKVVYDDTSSRLSNEDYRRDTLCNCLFAVVDDDVTDFEDTVLDNDNYGFSGLIVNLEKDEQGQETGYAIVRDNYIFSDEVMAQLPDRFIIEGNNYLIKDYDKLKADGIKPNDSTRTKEVNVLHNNNVSKNYSAHFSENEKVGTLYINESPKAAQTLNKAYASLFGGDIVNMTGYDITLKDMTETVDINRFGQSVLYITVPIPYDAKTYHVVTLDEYGQLEELKCSVDKDNNSLTFETGHASLFGVYGIEEDNLVLNIKDGQLVKNYKLDESPETGDKSIPIKYILALALLASGCAILIFRKPVALK